MAVFENWAKMTLYFLKNGIFTIKKVQYAMVSVAHIEHFSTLFDL